MNKAIKVSLYISFVLIICALSKNIMMLNTSDFGRAIKPLIEDIPAFTYDLPLLYKLKGHIDSIDSYEYISSYSYILYTYVLFISIFTEYLDARVLSLFLKVIYIYSLYAIFTSYIKTERYVTYIYILYFSFSYVFFINTVNVCIILSRANSYNFPSIFGVFINMQKQ